MLLLPLLLLYQLAEQGKCLSGLWSTGDISSIAAAAAAGSGDAFLDGWELAAATAGTCVPCLVGKMHKTAALLTFPPIDAI